MDLQSLFTISELKVDETMFSASIRFDPDHPILKGHFPGKPVIPGVCLIRITKDIASQLLNKPLILIKTSNIKFLNIIDPEKLLSIHCSGTLQSAEPGSFQVSVTFNSTDAVFFKFKGTFH